VSSPIESLLLNAILEVAPSRALDTAVFEYRRKHIDERPAPNCLARTRPLGEPFADLDVYPQQIVDGYKIDFLAVLIHSGVRCLNGKIQATAIPEVSLAIECDGHQWHERTKQQAAYDRARDRALLRSGFTTVRFTGSEINRDPNQCARELLDTLIAVDTNRNWNIADFVGQVFGRGDRHAGVEEHW
jgi:REase_MTES_1575